jgi:hypothetical protein
MKFLFLSVCAFFLFFTCSDTPGNVVSGKATFGDPIGVITPEGFQMTVNEGQVASLFIDYFPTSGIFAAELSREKDSKEYYLFAEGYDNAKNAKNNTSRIMSINTIVKGNKIYLAPKKDFRGSSCADITGGKCSFLAGRNGCSSAPHSEAKCSHFIVALSAK